MIPMRKYKLAKFDLRKFNRNYRTRPIPITRSQVNTDLRSKAERRIWKNTIEAHKKKWISPVRALASDLFLKEGNKVTAAYASTRDINSTKHAISVFTPLWGALIERTWLTVGTNSSKVVTKAHINSLALTGVTVDLADPVLGWQRYVKKYFRSETGLKAVEDITDSSKLDIEAAIKRGMDVGETNAQIADRIDAMYKRFALGDEDKQSRAERIAQTEVNAATNYASLETMKEYGNATHKTWMCMMDNSRQWHIDADQQTVPIDEQFNVNDEDIDCPGDGSEENSINCNCDMEYSTKGE
jgi:hypothetical protein